VSRIEHRLRSYLPAVDAVDRRSAKGGEDGDKPSKARKGHKAKLWKAVTKG
jgi:hypothetical protein